MAWTLRDLNPRPQDYKSRALTTELRVQVLLRINKNSVPILKIRRWISSIYFIMSECKWSLRDANPEFHFAKVIC